MKRLLSFLMAAVLILTLAPSQFILEAHAASTYDEDFITLKRDDSTIAPGVTQTIATVRKKNNKQLVYYTMTVDTKVETAHIYANYKDNEWEPHSKRQYGLQEVTKQMDAAVKNHTDPNSDRYIENYTVVGGINGTGYDMATGQTRGVLVMEGHEAQAITNSEPFFAIMKDGTPRIFWNGKSDYEANKDDIQEAINSFVYPLIKNGEIVTTRTGDNNARTAIGITADKKVVMLVTDGKLTTSEGCDMGELASILYEAGCVDAFNLDGGGSTTFVSRPEGESKYRVVSNPCDGSPRSVSASLMVVSTEAPSDKLFRVALDPENDYVTPGSTVRVDAVGLNTAGSVLPIPDNAAWKLADSSLGSVNNGVFISNGKTGDAVVQMEVDGKVMGEATIHVMQPDSVAFKQTQIAVPYGKKADILIEVLSGVHSLAWKPEDFNFTVSDPKLGGMVGSQFAACEYSSDAPTGGTITATLVSDPKLTTTSTLTLGRSSEVVEDFESAEALKKVAVGPNNYFANYIMEASLADAETGMVHNGSHSLAITMDLTQMADYGGHQNLQMNYKAGDVDVTGLIGIGAWIWVPDEELITTIQQITWLSYYDGDEQKEYQNYKWEGGVNGYSGLSKDANAPYGDGHWYYFYRNLDGQKLEYEKTCLNGFYLLFDSQIAQVGFDTKSQNNKLTFYMDDITIDYSSVVDDREPPVFGDVTLHPNAADNNVTTDKNGVTECASTTVSFSAAVAENTSKSNATGINPDSAVALIDGVPVDAAWGNGILAVSGVTLTPGDHSLRLRIADNMGNYASTIRYFKITGDSKTPTVKLVPHNPAADRIPIGSVWYADIVATDVSAIDGVELKLDLNNNCTWQLDYADVDPEFEYSYSIHEAENIAAISLTRKGTADEDTREGDVILASLPIRTWEMNVPFTYYGEEGVLVGENDADRNGRPLKQTLSALSTDEKEYSLMRVTADFMWSKGYLWASDISVEVDLGEITYAEGRAPDTLPVFGGKVQVDTELFAKPATVKAAYPEKTRWHAHTLGQPEDKDPDCLHTGYTGRVFCTVCNSPVTWGTTVPAEGHTWAVAEDGENAGKMCCSVCGKLYTGELDGVSYKDGVTLEGWVDDSCYAEGVKYTGIMQAANPEADENTPETEKNLWYDFGEDGVCEGKKPYTGFFEQDGSRYYAELGVIQTGETETNLAGNEESGWFQVGDETCHACPGKGGALGKVTNTDSRTCVSSGYIFYTCETCKAMKMSDALWGQGHKWKSDTERVCTVCNTEAKDISKATLSFTNSPFFLYTGSAIRPALTVTDGEEQLVVESDRRGRDGLVTFSNNTQVGLATVKIEGRGDYDEKTTLVAHFTIVPGDVPEIRVTGQDNSSVTLEWDAAKGASYYAVYRKGSKDADWTPFKSVYGTTLKVDGLELGETYQFRVGSRGPTDVTDHNGDPIVSQNWTYTKEVTLAHDWSDYTVTAEPTCTEAGSRKRTCSLCGEEDAEVLPALGHDVAKWTVTKEPTIDEAGSRTGLCARCKETVTEVIPSLKPYGITVAECENGKITASPAGAAAEGTKITITAEADEGYELNELKVSHAGEDGNSVSVPVEEGCFTMPGADVTITASFTAIPTYTVSLPSGAGYTVTPLSGSASPVMRGGSYSFTVQIASGYVQNGSFAVKVNGKKLDAVKNVYTVEGITADQTVTVEGVEKFEAPSQYIVTLPTGAGYSVKAQQGSASPVKEGGYYIFSVQILKGYTKTDDFAITVNGVPLDLEEAAVTDTVYLGSIFNIKENKVITVEGVEEVVNNYKVTLPGADPAYSLVARTGATVPEGGSYSFEVTANAGYVEGRGFAVKANGQTLNADENGVYTISGIKEAKTVTVEGVEPQTWTVPEPETDGYKVKLTGKSEVEHGGSTSFVVLLGTGYYATGSYAVKANGVSLKPDNFGIYTISNITENQTIDVDGVEKLEIEPEAADPDVKVAANVTEEVKEVLEKITTDKVDTITKTEGVTRQLAEIIQKVIDAIKPSKPSTPPTEPEEPVEPGTEPEEPTEPEVPDEVDTSDIKVKVGLNIETTKYQPKDETTNASITLDIKPVYKVVQEVEETDEDGNTVKKEVPVEDEAGISLSGYLDTTSFQEPMDISVPLPGTFFGGTGDKFVIIRHNKGNTEIVEDRQIVKAKSTGGNWLVNFSAKSFSEYELKALSEGESSIEVTFDTGKYAPIAKQVMLSGDIGKDLPTVEVNETTTTTHTEANAIVTTTITYSYAGWKLNGEGDAYTELDNALFTALQKASDPTLVLAVEESTTDETREQIKDEEDEELSIVAVTVAETTGGKVSASPTTVKADDTVTVTAKPDAGYKLEKITVSYIDDSGVTKEVAVKDGKFTMPQAVVTVSASFVTVGGSTSAGDGGGGASSANVTVSSVSGGKVSADRTKAKAGDKVTLTVTPDTGKAVDTVTVTDGNGKAVAVTNAGSGKYTFTMPEGEVTVKATFRDEPAAPDDKPDFSDVPAGAYYADAVDWAVGRSIVNGTGNGRFSPDDSCTRAQIVTMLWRAAGCPEIETGSTFTDVSANSYYEKAVAWAVANGIVNGTGNGRFSPDDACTRAQAVTMLWRYEKLPGASGSGFSDVPDGSYYEDAVMWAASAGVVNGTGNGRFSPNETCTRAQIVTMLFRDMA